MVLPFLGESWGLPSAGREPQGGYEGMRADYWKPHEPVPRELKASGGL